MSTDYADIPALDEANLAVDDILDTVLTDPEIPVSALKEFLGDLEYRLNVAARELS